MHDTGDPRYAIQVLRGIQNDSKYITPALLYPILHAILHLLASLPRRDTLIYLASLLPAIQRAGGEQAILEINTATLEIGNWWP
jgi:hypothetical protein